MATLPTEVDGPSRGSTYVVGDIQGCQRSLDALLGKVGFGDADRLLCVGDLVNRGPDSLAVLRFARDLGHRFSCVLGNHDLHFLAMVYGGQPHRGSDTMEALLAAPDVVALAEWLRCQPLLMEGPDWVMVHAGIPPIWTLDVARRHAKEVETVLRGPAHGAFFRRMYGNEPALWHDGLVGIDRQRAIVNYFTRMRLLDAEGGMEFSHKGTLNDLPPGLSAVVRLSVARRQDDLLRPLGGARRRNGQARHRRSRHRLRLGPHDDRGTVGGWRVVQRGRRRERELRRCLGGVDIGSGTETYLVGGAVRDGLLGREPTEHDWVVVGATPAHMRKRGFRQVGRDFPVFLDPGSGDEYALARTERRVGPGHADFVCHADPDVTLEQDLARRDLTINAMARNRQGVLIDPHGGQRDIDDRLLRHVSPAFREDPLRGVSDGPVRRATAGLRGCRGDTGVDGWHGGRVVHAVWRTRLQGARTRGCLASPGAVLRDA